MKLKTLTACVVNNVNETDLHKRSNKLLLFGRNVNTSKLSKRI